MNHSPTKHLCNLVPAPYLHKFSAVVQILHFFGAIWKTLLSIYRSFSIKIKKIMQKKHLLMVLFGMNLLGNISTKSLKKSTIFKARLSLLIQISLRWRYLTVGLYNWNHEFKPRFSIKPKFYGWFEKSKLGFELLMFYYV